MDEEQGIYRGEVESIMVAPADLTVDVRTILGYFEGDDGELASGLPCSSSLTGSTARVSTAAI